MTKTAVLAFGGNALLPTNEEGTQSDQEHHAASAASMIMDLEQQGHDMIIVHGNGPQVGNELIRVEEAITKVPPCTLDYCVAKTQGEIGHMLEKAIRNTCLRRNIDKPVASLLTQVMVQQDDPGFENPTKPVGPYYTQYRASTLQKERDWAMKKISDKGYRRLVPSPRPQKIMNIDLIKQLQSDAILITAGGGGIPVYHDDQQLRSAEAVIDKDYTASLIADELQADRFILLTNVPKVYRNWGSKHEEPIDTMTVEEARRYDDAGEFPDGSMGPKVRATIEFVSQNEDREALITSAEALPEALNQQNGTRIIAGPPHTASGQ